MHVRSPVTRSSMTHFSYMIVDSKAFLKSDIPAIFSHIKASGYEGVEMNITSELLRHLDRIEQCLQANGLVAPSFLTGAAYEDGLCLSSPDEEIRHRTVERLKSYLPIGKRFNAILVVGLLQGLRSDEADPVVANQRIIEGLREVGQAADSLGVTIVIEPVNHLQVGFNHSVAEVRELIAKIDSPALKSMVDTIHMNIEDTSLTQPIHDCGPDLRHVHLCESHGGPLGSGHIDFGSVLRALEAINYEGFASVKIYRKATMEGAIAPSIEYLTAIS